MSEIFICYAHSDEKLHGELVEHLKNLEELGVTAWSDKKIAVGADWLGEIEAALERCDAAVMLVSAKFLNSKFIKTIEVPALLQARDARGAVVIPLIARTCNWHKIEWLAAMQVRPSEGKPVLPMSTAARDIVLSGLALEIETLLAKRPPKRQSPTVNETIELTLDGDFKGSEALIARAVEEALRSFDVKVHRQKKGSLKLIVELPESAIVALQATLDRGFFAPPGMAITGRGLAVELYEYRGMQVLMDESVAGVYGYKVKALNQARDRNAERFDEDYAFQLTAEEWADLKSQTVTAKKGRGGRRTPPWVYTEKGATMMATVLRTPAAVEASKLIVETFVAARAEALDVPPNNHDGIGEADRETDEKRAFKSDMKRLYGRRS